MRPFFLVGLLVLGYGFIVEYNLTLKPLSGTTNWGSLYLEADHRDRQPNQSPSQWTNMTLKIFECAAGVQLTSQKPRTDRHIIVTEEIPFIAVNTLQNYLLISISWWGTPWTLYIGWITVPPGNCSQLR